MPSKGEKKREREKGLRFRTRTASSSGSNKHVDVLLRRPTTGRREQQQRHNSRTDRKKTPVANLIDDGITQEEGRKKNPQTASQPVQGALPATFCPLPSSRASKNSAAARFLTYLL